MKRNRKAEHLVKEMNVLYRKSRECAGVPLFDYVSKTSGSASILLFDRRGVIRFISDLARFAARAFVGCSFAEGRSIWDCVSEKDSEFFSEHLNRALFLGEFMITEREVEHPGGGICWFSLHFHPVLSEGGDINGVYLTVADITSRRRAAESSHLMSRAFMYSSSAIALMDLTGIILETNPAFLKFWGYSSREEVKDRHIGEFWKSEKGILEIRDILSLRGDITLDGEGIRSGGGRFDVEAQVSLMFDEEVPDSLMASFVDITRLKEIEKALKENKKRLECLLENQQDLVVEFNGDCRLEYVNANYMNLFGKTEAELLGSSFFPMVHVEDWGTVMRALDDLRHPPHQCRYQERALTVEGWKQIQWHNQALVDQDRNIEKVIAVGRKTGGSS